MIRMPYVASRVFNTPVAVHPGKAAAILAGIGGRIVGGTVEIDGSEPLNHVAFAQGRPILEGIGLRPQMGRLGDPLGQNVDPSHLLTRFGTVAVITIEGTLVHKGKWIGTDSGETSYEGLWAQIGAAHRDPAVEAVVFEVDSCGGEVSGAFDVADAIHELSAAKPTIAILTDHAYSAGYLLASAARSIVMPVSGGCGSIGVITLHVDYAAALEEAGIKVTVLAAGKHKADGNPFEALPEDVATKVRGQLEALRKEFAGAVGRYRGARFSAADALATEARDFDASDDPVGAGLVDAIARPSEAFAAFVAEFQT
ncbi:MAG: S49 family peptidase [Reyranella sp.]|uniref:S49 family peptidase n=1 Tax=Reyranella sp. TaxID=1929291 RepID=UPI0025DE15F4|nr:S49 family peptidase [Reyranella sp.]MBR2819834.1 S49 family peptidase [Reyranella sp.]